MSIPDGKIRRDTRVFISAVTRELASVRRFAKKALEDNDYHAIEQDNFPPDYRDLKDKLRQRIESCDAVIHIAGHCYGAEPRQRPPEAPRRSYTQIEYDIALELDKPVYVFLTGDGFPMDPHEPEPAELQELQEAHRRRLTSTGRDYSRTASTEQLDQKIRSLQLKVERLEGELQQVDRQVAVTGSRLRRWLVAFAVLGVAAIGTGGYFGWRQQVENRAQEQERAKQERERLATEAARMESRKTQQEIINLVRGEFQNNKKITFQDARQRAVQELAKQLNRPEAEIEALINGEVGSRNTGTSPSPLDQARAALAQGKIDEVLQASDDQRQQGREMAMLEGTAALARFRQTPSPKWNERALAAFQRAMTQADPKSATEWEAWTDAAVSAASVLDDLARYSEAEPLLRECRRLREADGGPNSPGLAVVLNNLAGLLRDTNRLAEAEPLYRRALAIGERSYGPDHTRVATRLGNLAGLLRATNRPAGAEPLYRRALAIDERSHGPDHPDVATDLNNLALLLKATGRPAAAEPLMRRALAIGERSHGPGHPSVATRLGNLALLLWATGRPAEAEPLLRRALAIDERSHGPGHPSVAIDLNNLALLLEATKRMEEAEPLMARVVGISSRFRRSTGHEHPQFLDAKNDYLQLLSMLKLAESEIAARMKSAREGADELSPIAPEVERLLGPAEPVADVLASLDRQYKEQGKPAVYFLEPNEPITPHLDEFLRPNGDGLNAQGVIAFRGGAHADAVVLFEAALELTDNQPAQVLAKFRVRMNRAAGLRELALVEQARDELARLVPELEQDRDTDSTMKGRAFYHLALCQWRLGERAEAQGSTEKSLASYDGASGAKPVDPALRRQSEGLLADLKDGKAPPPLAAIDSPAPLEAARARYRAREALTKLALNQASAPFLDKILGPAGSTKEVLDALDRQYREQGKPPVWFVPLEERMAPHLDQLLDPAKTAQEVLDALDRQYREEGKPPVWFLPLDEPITPHLDELLGNPSK